MASLEVSSGGGWGCGGPEVDDDAQLTQGCRDHLCGLDLIVSFYGVQALRQAGSYPSLTSRETLEKSSHSRGNALVITGRGLVYARQAAWFR